ncbi:MAG: hypothetical protein ACTSU5_02305 [Promethearchaeota archaeon]
MEANFIFKVESDSAHAAHLFGFYSNFMARAYQNIGVSMFVEPIETGAVVFYENYDDFHKFHRFAQELVPLVGESEEKGDSGGGEPLEISIEIVKKAPEVSTEEIFRLMRKYHGILSTDIDVARLSERKILIKYANAPVFEEIFKSIEEVLGEKGK